MNLPKSTQLSAVIFRASLVSFTLAALMQTGHAQTQKPPLKIALIEALSGSQSNIGAIFLTAAQYSVEQLNAAGGYNGQPIQLIPYDNQGTPAGAADRVTAAIGDGANIILNGTSSTIAGQVTDDVRRYNLRNPKQPVIYLNTGAEALELTGEKCHFFHYKFALDAESRLHAVAQAIKSGKIKAKSVFSIHQNYSWGKDLESAVNKYASVGGYKVAGSVLHDLNKIQDFTPYVARIAATDADTVITGNWGTDLVRLIRASADSKLQARFITMFLDQPGNISGAGESAEGHINVEVFSAEANGPRGFAFEKAFLDKTKVPALVSSHVRTIFAVQFLGEALKLAPPQSGKIDTTAIALALEKATLDSAGGRISMRSEDHQALLPIAITQVSRDAASKVENSPFGFKPIQRIEGVDAVGPVQQSCKIQRPA